MKRLAIIPARGGSKRIPNKNVRDFCAQPMISYILNSASKSGLFDIIHVSTDDPAIESVCSDLGFKPDFSRPAHLADDHTPLMPVLKYVAEEYETRGQQFDEIWLLMACSPLLAPEDLQAAAEVYANQEDEKQHPLMAVIAYPAPTQWAFQRKQNGHLSPLNPGMFKIRSQDLEEHYYDAGAYYIFPPKTILESQNAGSDQHFIGDVIPHYKSVDIDTQDDWKLAEILYTGLKNMP